MFERYRLLDVARKVVGRRERRNPLLDRAVRGPRRPGADLIVLQAKEAGRRCSSRTSASRCSATTASGSSSGSA